ncbi:hypothetical protein EV184_10641 [Sinorhizobium americanum]|uniref:Uncharacterized protein n=1 Tax=Sinorhizobium americanum TaxID=194963 RepID=A0A4R2BYJ0_9HYPH|nr:hypothetical protein EV184_10641 [Sinorhizobium americanum]
MPLADIVEKLANVIAHGDKGEVLSVSPGWP